MSPVSGRRAMSTPNRLTISAYSFTHKSMLLVFLLTWCKHNLALRLSMSAASTNNNNGMAALEIAFVTGNEMKAKEMSLILEKHGAKKNHDESALVPLVNLRVVKVDLPEIQEIDTRAIAKNKAIQGAQLAGGPCVVEDTSLMFHALGGMPGPFIKWFQDKLGASGLHKILSDYEDKSATAVCTLAFCSHPHADPVLFTGKTKGRIIAPLEGGSVGWDSIFVPDGESIPFSKMSTEKKNSLSHRGQAVRKLADWLAQNKEELFRRQGGGTAIGHKGLHFKTVSPEE